MERQSYQSSRSRLFPREGVFKFSFLEKKNPLGGSCRLQAPRGVSVSFLRKSNAQVPVGVHLSSCRHPLTILNYGSYLKMWEKEYKIETSAETGRIWSLLEDVKNWNKWNVDIEYSFLNGNFENGTYGSYKTTKGLNSIFILFELKNCVTNRSVTCRIKLFLGIMDIGYEIINENNAQKVQHFIKIYGPLTFYYKNKFGINILKRLQLSVKKLVNLAKLC